jgi:hypothetical protein
MLTDQKTIKTMKIRSYLLPSALRLPGIVMTIAGVLLLVAKYQFNYKPEFLNLKVFAVYTYVIKSQSFTMITNQMAEEIGGIFLLCGLFVTAFSRERVESDNVDAIRLKAFLLTAYFNLIFLICSVLFFFGFGFVGALVLFAVAWLIFYLLIFRYLLYIQTQKVRKSEA